MNGQQAFTAVGGQLPATQFTFSDPIIERKFGDSFQYHVVAGNSAGSSVSGLSAVVSPGSSLNISHSPVNYMESSYANQGARFGFKLAFSGDGASVAVATKNRSFMPSLSPRASVEIFERVVRNEGDQVFIDWSQASVAVIPFTTASKMSLESFTLSPDGNTLALSDLEPASGEISGAGSVQLITKNSLGEWNTTPMITLVSPVRGHLYRFGSVLLFSPDSKTLVVAETGTGLVRLYNNDVTTGWPALPNGVLNEQTLTSTKLIDPALAFNSSGNILAVGDPQADVDDPNAAAVTLPSAGKVQLFAKQTDGSWDPIAETVLISKNPGSNYLFGKSVAFTTDGRSIAIGEERTQLTLDNGSAYRGGNVQLYRQDSANLWKAVADNVFVSSSQGNGNFGHNIAFNSAGTLLAISERNGEIYTSGSIGSVGSGNNGSGTKGGAVYVFKTDDQGAWVERPAAVLGSNRPVVYGEFGASFGFGPSDIALLIGEPGGVIPGLVDIEVGYVNIYDTGLF